MALAISGRTDVVIGDKRGVRCNMLFDSAYPTGGEAFTPSQVGLTEVTELWMECGVNALAAGSQSGLSVKLGGTRSAPTLLAYDATATEVANGTDLSLRGVNVIVLGK